MSFSTGRRDRMLDLRVPWLHRRHHPDITRSAT
jgi:hypothetical protein